MSFLNFSRNKPFSNANDLLDKYQKAENVTQRLRLVDALVKNSKAVYAPFYPGVSNTYKEDLYFQAANYILLSLQPADDLTIDKVRKKIEHRFLEKIFIFQFNHENPAFKKIGLDNLITFCSQIPFHKPWYVIGKNWWFEEEIFLEANAIAINKIKNRLLSTGKEEISSVSAFFITSRWNAYKDLLKKQRGGMKEGDIQQMETDMETAFPLDTESTNIVYLELMDALQTVPDMHKIYELSRQALHQISGKLQHIGLDIAKRVKDLIEMERQDINTCLELLFLNFNGMPHVDIFDRIFDVGVYR